MVLTDLAAYTEHVLNIIYDIKLGWIERSIDF
jgi:hypothetical protein